METSVKNLKIVNLSGLSNYYKQSLHFFSFKSQLSLHLYLDQHPIQRPSPLPTHFFLGCTTRFELASLHIFLFKILMIKYGIILINNN